MITLLILLLLLNNMGSPFSKEISKTIMGVGTKAVSSSLVTAYEYSDWFKQSQRDKARRVL